MSNQQNSKPDAATNDNTEGGVITAQRKDQNTIDVDQTVHSEEKSASKLSLTDKPVHVAQNASAPDKNLPYSRPVEHGGQAGLEPTRYGDWEKKGRCTDF